MSSYRCYIYLPDVEFVKALFIVINSFALHSVMCI